MKKFLLILIVLGCASSVSAKNVYNRQTRKKCLYAHYVKGSKMMRAPKYVALHEECPEGYVEAVNQ